MNREDHIELLLKRVLENVATDDDLLELTKAVESEDDEILINRIEEVLNKEPMGIVSIPGNERCDELVDSILAADKVYAFDDINKESAPVFSFFRKVAAAAVLIAMAAGVVWVINSRGKNNATGNEIAFQKANDKLPATNKATLTLADGSVVMLDNSVNGNITTQGQIKVLKLNSGQLAYEINATAASHSGEALYNTLNIPRGGQFELVLSDGTKVWLNSSSSIRFPAAFTGKERNVELKGEGYFEVAKNTSMPFNVISKDMTVQVLGTHFNVMAYEDETVTKATLLEGKVKVKTENGSGLLKPGQQAVYKAGNKNVQVTDVDTEESVAWKNGYFQFNKINEASLMQLSRWYDIDLVIEGKIRENEFKGKIARNIKLSSVVEALQISGIHCRIEKNKLIVSQ